MNYTKITSASNPKIKQALDIKNKRSKHKSAAFIIEGPHLIEMAAASGHGIKEVFFTYAFSQRKDGQRLLGQLSKKSYENNPPPPPFSKGGMGGFSCEIFEVTDQILHKLTDTETPQGIVAIASYNPITLYDIVFKSIPLIVIVEGVQEPGNLGAIIRTSDAADADAVIIFEGTCDAFSHKTIRATAGSIFNIPIINEKKDRVIKWLKSNGIGLIATALDSKKSLFDEDLKKSIAFVFGNEAHGVSAEIKKSAFVILKIPIPGKAESLNVSASAAICLYEAVRQRIGVSV
ncbi:MAG: RNA methyltransferase [Thermodesulfovibrionales bacterium]|nr:RNA methyltransferase [Thermodesulfovibrionales bacterium]